MPLEPDRRHAPLYAPDSSRESRDRAWVESIRTGDVPAFEAMFRAYKNDLGAFVMSWVHSREAAEEVIQDLFLHLWEQRHEWQPPVPLNIYLFRAARNRAIDYLRHQRVETEFQQRVAQRRDEEDLVDRPPEVVDGDDAVGRGVTLIRVVANCSHRKNAKGHAEDADIPLVHVALFAPAGPEK